MKTRLIILIIFAVLVLLFPLVSLLPYNIGNQVMINGMTVSGSTVLLVSTVFSAFSWFLFAWASKSIKVEGILLSIISGSVLMIPFYDVLGPMASVIIGLVAGFVAFMFHKHMISRDKKSLIITIATVVASYLALTIMIVLVTFSSVSNGNGIGAWSGTAEGMERQVEVFGFSFFVDNIPTGNPNECWYQDENGEMAPCLVHSDTLDLDPDLSPSYALDFAMSTFYLTILPLTAIGGGIAALFLVPYFILKRKNIPSRPYMVVILSGLLLHYSITEIIRSVIHLSRMLHGIDKGELSFIAPVFVSMLIPVIVLCIAGILLYRSSVIRKLIRK